jgi:hypothetical protein
MNKLIKILLIILLLILILGNSKSREKFSSWVHCSDKDDCKKDEVCHNFHDKDKFMDEKDSIVSTLFSKNKFCQIKQGCFESKNNQDECEEKIAESLNDMCNNNWNKAYAVQLLNNINKYCKNKNYFLDPEIKQSICWDKILERISAIDEKNHEGYQLNPYICKQNFIEFLDRLEIN